MAKCPSCSNAELSDNTGRCPLCGYAPLPKRPGDPSVHRASTSILGGEQTVARRLSSAGPSGSGGQRVPDASRQQASSQALSDKNFAILQKELSDEFRIEPEFRRGKRSLVYRAQEVGSDRPVALKIVLTGGTVDDALASRFREKAALVQALDHPRIVSLYKFGVTKRFFWYSMEYLEEQSLETILGRDNRIKRVGGALGIVDAVADALGYAYLSGVTHGDVKPRNIFVDKKTGARLSDFAMGGLFGRPGSPTAPSVLRHPEYMAPEQFFGSETAGPEADQYALALVAFRCLVGKPPFTGHTFKEIAGLHAGTPAPLVDTLRPDVPIHVRNAIQRALSKAPEERFADMSDFTRAIAGPKDAAKEVELPSKKAPPTVAPARKTGPIPALGGFDDLIKDVELTATKAPPTVEPAGTAEPSPALSGPEDLAKSVELPATKAPPTVAPAGTAEPTPALSGPEDLSKGVELSAAKAPPTRPSTPLPIRKERKTAPMGAPTGTPRPRRLKRALHPVRRRRRWIIALTGTAILAVGAITALVLLPRQPASVSPPDEPVALTLAPTEQVAGEAEVTPPSPAPPIAVSEQDQEPPSRPAAVRQQPAPTPPVRAQPAQRPPVRAQPAQRPPVRAQPTQTPPVRAQPTRTPPVRAQPRPTPPAAAPPPRPAAAVRSGRLFINATPWGVMYIDGEEMGNTPQINVAVPAGSHVLRVVREGFEPFEREIEVAADEVLRITDITLVPQEQ